MNWFKTLIAQFDSQIENHNNDAGDSFSTDPSLALSQTPNDLDFAGLKNSLYPENVVPLDPKNPFQSKLTPKGKGKGIRKHKGNQVWRHPPHGAHIPNNSNDPSKLESLTESLNSPPSPMFI